jgi:HK97 gp10 family phage protein
MIDFSDVTEFAARLGAPIEIVEEGWQGEWSRKVADEMRRNAPVLTGELRASIEPAGDGVTVGVPYGSFVEYGTSDTRAQPYAAPAVNRLIRPAAKDAGDRVVRQLT